MELKAGDLSKIIIFIFILLVGLVGTYIEFRKPKRGENDYELNPKRINKEILEELKSEDSHI